MTQFFKILRSPDGTESMGGAPETASATNDTTTGSNESAQPSGNEQLNAEGDAQTAESAKGNGNSLAELQEKAKDPNYRFTADELEMLENSEFQPEDEHPEQEQKEESNKTPDSLAEALKEVGAQSAEELLPKIKELKKFIGSRDAQAFAQLDKQYKETLTREKNNIAWLEDLQKGEPGAIEYLKKFLPPTAATQLPQLSPDQYLIDEDEFISPDAGRKVNGIVKGLQDTIQTLKSELDGVKQSTSEATEHYRNQAKTAQIESTRKEIATGLAAIASDPEFKSYLAPTSGNVFDLLREYWQGNDGDPVDPRIEPLISVLEEAKQIGGNDLNAALKKAAKLASFDRVKNGILTAEQRGRQSLAKPSLTPASLAPKTTNGTYSESDVHQMLKGQKRIPDSWMDGDGDLDIGKIPANLRHIVA